VGWVWGGDVGGKRRWGGVGVRGGGGGWKRGQVRSWVPPRVCFVTGLLFFQGGGGSTGLGSESLCAALARL